MKDLAEDAEMREYGLLKRIIDAIERKRDLVEQTDEANEELKTQEDNEETNENENNNKKIRASHPTHSQSPPSKAQRIGEGRGT